MTRHVLFQRRVTGLKLFHTLQKSLPRDALNTFEGVYLVVRAACQVEPLLNIMVFGESTINDAVAIALFRASNNPDVDLNLYHVCMNMAWLLVGSSCAGLIVGWLLQKLLQCCHMHNTSHGVTVINMTCYFVYALAEHLHLSGIIASLFCGILMSNLLKTVVEPAMFEKASFTLKQNAVVADMTVFMFVGVAVWLLGSFSAIPTAILVGIFCLFARAAAVFPLGVFVNCIKRRSGRRMSLPQAASDVVMCVVVPFVLVVVCMAFVMRFSVLDAMVWGLVWVRCDALLVACVTGGLVCSCVCFLVERFVCLDVFKKLQLLHSWSVRGLLSGSLSLSASVPVILHVHFTLAQHIPVYRHSV